VDLLGELPGRDDDEGGDLGVAAGGGTASEELKGGDCVGEGFTGTC